VTFVFEFVKANVATVTDTVPLGPPVIVVCGGVVSIVQP
jgi:hypothetical protein